MNIDFNYDTNVGKWSALNRTLWTDDENDDANNSDSTDDNGINMDNDSDDYVASDCMWH